MRRPWGFCMLALYKTSTSVSLLVLATASLVLATSPIPSAVAAASPITAYQIGTGTNHAVSNLVVGSEGNLWFTDTDGCYETDNNGGPCAIGRITETGAATDFAQGLAFHTLPSDLTVGPEGNVWFIDRGGHAIGRITSAGAIAEFTQGLNTRGYPENLVIGADHDLWFTEEPEGWDGTGPAPTQEQSNPAVGEITPQGVVAAHRAEVSGFAAEGHDSILGTGRRHLVHRQRPSRNRHRTS